MLRVERKRRQAGKETVFRYRGEVVEERKLERAGRSIKISDRMINDDSIAGCKFHLSPL